MRLVLFGATGMIGSRIAIEAVRRGHDVTGATRSGGGGTRAGDASEAEVVAQLVAGHDAVVLAVSPPQNSTALEAVAAIRKVGQGVLEGMDKVMSGALQSSAVPVPWNSPRVHGSWTQSPTSTATGSRPGLPARPHSGQPLRAGLDLHLPRPNDRTGEEHRNLPRGRGPIASGPRGQQPNQR